jgi:spore coat protein U-like protein
MIKLAIIITFIATLISGCSSEPPVAVELKSRVTHYPPMGDALTTEIHISAQVDSIKVNSIVVNRGNCKVNGHGTSLNFGQHAKFEVNGYSCDVKEVEVDTEEGNFTFTF